MDAIPLWKSPRYYSKIRHLAHFFNAFLSHTCIYHELIILPLFYGSVNSSTLKYKNIRIINDLFIFWIWKNKNPVQSYFFKNYEIIIVILIKIKCLKCNFWRFPLDGILNILFILEANLPKYRKIHGKRLLW